MVPLPHGEVVDVLLVLVDVVVLLEVEVLDVVGTVETGLLELEVLLLVVVELLVDEVVGTVELWLVLLELLVDVELELLEVELVLVEVLVVVGGPLPHTQVALQVWPASHPSPASQSSPPGSKMPSPHTESGAARTVAAGLVCGPRRTTTRPCRRSQAGASIFASRRTWRASPQFFHTAMTRV